MVQPNEPRLSEWPIEIRIDIARALLRCIDEQRQAISLGSFGNVKTFASFLACIKSSTWRLGESVGSSRGGAPNRQANEQTVLRPLLRLAIWAEPTDVRQKL